jgi:NADH-quinone oxidoreductase subunit M
VSWVIFLPLIFSALVALIPGTEKGQIRVVTGLGMVVTFTAALWMYLRLDPKGPEFQLEQRVAWITDLGVSYHVGVDGLAASLMLLTALLGPLVVLASSGQVQERVKEFHLALLVLQTAMLGALASLDLVLFYVFWEAMLVPMYLLIGVWGSEERVAAAVKFFLYTLVGSFLMLVAILALYYVSQPSGGRTFDFIHVYNALIAANREASSCANAPETCAHLTGAALAIKSYGPWMFAAFAIAFAVKVPMFPVHTWLPDAHVQAPMAGSMILAGVMLKMGTFGFWRYAIPLFPAAARQFRSGLAVLAVIGIVYGAMMCLAQRDVKRLIAYSSVSHLGFCMLGMLALTVEGASGSAYQMLNHGVSTGALFLLFGLLYARRHSRLIADYGGIAKVMPVFAAFFLIITFASIAVPGTNGFVGEFLVLLGTFKSSLPMGFGIAAATAVVLGAAYMLWMVQRVFFGPLNHRENQHLTDFNLREVASALPLVALVLVMGLAPQPFLDRLAAPSDRFVARASFGARGAYVSDDAVRMTGLELAATPPIPSVPPPQLIRPPGLQPTMRPNAAIMPAPPARSP